MAYTCVHCGHYFTGGIEVNGQYFCSESCRSAYFEKLNVQYNIQQELEEKNRRENQTYAAEKLKDNYKVFGLERDGFRRRVAENGFYEYKLAGCDLSNFVGNETEKSSIATCNLKVGTLLNKTPEGTGKLNFVLLLIPAGRGMGTPFISSTDEETGLEHWKSNSYREGFNGWRFAYSSEPFTLGKEENVDRRSYSLKRTPVGLCAGKHDVYVVLLEQTDDGRNHVAAWCEAGEHIVTSHEGELTNFNTPILQINKKNLHIYTCSADIKTFSIFSIHANEAVEGLWAKMYLTDVETGKEYKSKSTDYFSVDAFGDPTPCMSSGDKLELNFSFAETLPESAYNAEIRICQELKGSEKSKVLDKIYLSTGYGFEATSDGKIARTDGQGANIWLSRATYSIHGNKINIKIGLIEESKKRATAPLKVCLEWQRKTLATFYLDRLHKGETYNDIAETVDYMYPQWKLKTPVYIDVYELKVDGNWYRVSSYPSYCSKEVGVAEAAVQNADRKIEETTKSIKSIIENIAVFIRRNLINAWCAAGLYFLLYEQLFLGKRNAWSVIPSLVLTPFWLPFSTWAGSENNLKLMPVFYAIWGAACAWTHFRYGGGIACLIGVAIYAAGIIKYSSKSLFKFLIGLVAVGLAALVFFMK